MEPIKGGTLVNLPEKAEQLFRSYAPAASNASWALRFAASHEGVMMVLSGIGDSIAAHVCYALDRVARLYEREGDEDAAGLRRLQARAVAESFGCDPAEPPAELVQLDAELFPRA